MVSTHHTGVLNSCQVSCGGFFWSPRAAPSDLGSYRSPRATLTLNLQAAPWWEADLPSYTHRTGATPDTTPVATSWCGHRQPVPPVSSLRQESCSSFA